MSSTGRSDVRQRDDHYRTPDDVVDALLGVVHLSDGPICDPGCGEGAILDRILGMTTGEHGGPDLFGIEVDPARASVAGESHTVIQGDFLTMEAKTLPDANAVVMNPPFSLAREFVDASIRLVTSRDLTGRRVWEPGGHVAGLLRLAFLESQKRREWWWRNPADVYVLPKRPSFTGDGKTDSCAYAWFVWGPGPRGRITVL